MNKPFHMGDRLRSFRFALNGIAVLIKTQHNAWLHLLGTTIVLTMGFVFQVSTLDWCLLVVAISQVWVAETMNTAVEYLADAVTLDHHPLIGKAKDVAAGAVLLSAIGATVIGMLVFLPHIWF